MAPVIVSLRSWKAVSPSWTGGKGASLARLLRAGFSVPPGFVVTTAAFHGVLEDAAVQAGVSRPFNHAPKRDAPLTPEIEKAFSVAGLEVMRRTLHSWEMPAPLRRAVVKAYLRLGGPVAVRSSMVGEDAETESFAGQLDTVLNVEGKDALFDAIRCVLASAFGERFWAYLHKAGSATGHPPPSVVKCPAMAVVVQRMVQSEVSGVAFSVDPVTCAPGIVIEAVPGLGEDLVQGRVCPDRYRLNSHLMVAEFSTAQPGRRLLDETKARAIGELVRSIADLAAAPQDVEWSFDGRLFYVLQARPISTIAGKTVFSRRMVSDMAPGLVKPLIWSTKSLSMVENVFGRIFDALLGPTGADYTRLVARIHSRLYTDVTMLSGLFSRIGLPANFFEVVAREEKAVHPKVRFHVRMIPAFLRFLRFTFRELRVGKRLEPFFESQHRKLDEFRAMDGDSRNPRTLVDDFGRLIEAHAGAQWFIVVVSMNMAVRRKIMTRLIKAACPGTNPDDVIKGYGRRESLAPFEAMKELAGEVKRLDRDLITALSDGTGLDIPGALTALKPGRVVLDGFEKFMARYGFLSANGSDFSEVPWIENPRLIWRTVARLALAQEAPNPGAAESHREEALRRVRSRLGPLRRRVFDRLQASTVWFIARRERLSLLMTEGSFLMRRYALAVGGKLVERGSLDAAGDVFFLLRSELERLASDGGGGEEIRAIIRARKAEMAADEALDPPDTFCGSEALSWQVPSAEGLEFLSGIGASAGVRTGRARIVHDPALEGLDLGPADILIVPFTDVGWIPILSGIGAIVAQTGGQLSHTSIIAREYGIPAVVSVPGATRLIREGQTVTVDGTSGRVVLHTEEGPV